MIKEKEKMKGPEMFSSVWGGGGDNASSVTPYESKYVGTCGYTSSSKITCWNLFWQFFRCNSEAFEQPAPCARA